MEGFKFTDEEKKSATDAKKVYETEITELKDKLSILQTEAKRIPTIGLDITLELLQNIINTSNQRIRHLQSEIFLCSQIIAN